MATDIVMPNLGFDTQTGLLVEWLKKPGESVKKGEALAVIESDKADAELESVATGVVLAQLYEAGDEVQVGAVIARVGAAEELAAPAEAQPEVAPPRVKVEASPVARRLAADNDVDLAAIQGSGPRGRIRREDVEAAISAQAAPQTGGGNGQIRALPKVRKAAREAGINLAEVMPSGPGGTITLADVAAFKRAAEAPAEEAAAAAPVKAPADVATTTAPAAAPEGAAEVPLSRARRVIGQRLAQSMREAPHFYVSGEFDLEAALVKLQALAARQPGGPPPRINDLIQYLAVQTLRRVPALNATFVEGRLYRHEQVNLAVAVAREDGLLTPVIHKADRYSLTGLAAESRELIARARNERLPLEALQGGTFTISNLGTVKQVDHFTAVINPPQVAILAVGTVKQRPVVVDNGLHIRHTVHLTLSGDHRVVDGMDLGRFMAVFQEELDAFS